MIRLVILTRSLDYGGAERQLVALAKGLHERGHRVVVAVFYGGGPLERELHDAGVPVETLQKRGRWDTLGFLLRLVRFLRRERPRIVHGYLEFPNILALVVKPLVHVRVVWGVRASNRDLRHYDWLTRLVSLIERALARFPDLIIANAYAGRDHVVARGFPPDRVIVIPNGLATDRFRPDRPAGQHVRDELGIGSTEVVVGLVGRLDPMKDHPTFLAAAARLRRERPALRFLCIGNGPESYAVQLRRLATSLGLDAALCWVGGRGDMPAVFNALDVAVSASATGEGFPNVVGEAMACGVPCVVTDVGDSAHVVGDVGQVVPPGDPAALADAIGRVLDLKAAGTLEPAAGRSRILSCFGRDVLINRTEQALQSLSSEQSP